MWFSMQKPLSFIESCFKRLATFEHGKRDKHLAMCSSYDLDFIPFGFSTFWSFGLAIEDLLSHICQRYVSHARIPEWEAHAWVFHRLSFAIMRGVAEQFVGRELLSFRWWCLCGSSSLCYLACNFVVGTMCWPLLFLMWRKRVNVDME